ncbi:MAG: AAA family ATPase [Candidatus Helarchaeota archaeon]
MFEKIITVIKENHFLFAGLGISGFGLITFWIKDVPLKIFNFFKRQFTTDLIVTNYDEVFYELLNYLHKQNKTKKFRTFRLHNGRWGTADKSDLIMGYGTHFIRYQNTWLFLDYTREKESISDKIKEIVTLTKFGRSRKLFEKMINDLLEIKKQKKDKISFYRMDDGWCYCRDIRKRPLNSVFLEQSKKDLLLTTLKEFKEKEQWYLDSGIPYQLGILLYGQPGTGKSSLIKALASYLNYSIYYLSPSKLSVIQKAFNELRDESVIVIEDLDTNTVTAERKKSSKKKSKVESDDLFESFSVLNLSDILNSLDGIANAHGRVLFATTNHIEKLDKALIRPGRFDLLLELGYVNKEILKQFFDYHFPNNKVNYKNLKIKSKLTMAELQQILLQNYTVQQILEKINE